MKRAKQIVIRFLQIYVYLIICTVASGQSQAWEYADSMMQTQEGDSMYQVYLEEAQISDLTDSAEIEADAYFAAMSYFIAQWYVENGEHICTSDRSPTNTMCYNSDWMLSAQSDTLLEGWEMCDGRRPSVIPQCNTDIFFQVPLPDEARPTVAEAPQSGYRFNLDPTNNGLVNSLFPLSVRFAANYHSFELYIDEEDVIIPDILSPIPPSGARSIRINNDHIQGHVNTIRRQFWVDSGTPTYYFSYAFVMEDPDHGDSLNPFFRVVLRDQYCDVVEELCVIANVGDEDVAFVDLPGFDPIVYRQWRCHSFDLTPYTGQPVTIEFTAADCGRAGHFAYAYIADICEECGSYPEIALDSTQYFCLPFPMEFCGDLDLAEDYSFIDLSLEVSQHGDSISAIDSYIYDTITGEFCFEIEVTDVALLDDGGYDVYAIALLINPNGDTIELRSYSATPNTLGSSDNDFFIGDHFPQIELDLFVDCEDSTTYYLSGDYNPFFFEDMILEEGHIVWVMSKLSLKLTIITHSQAIG